MPRRVARIAPNHWNTLVLRDPRPGPAPTIEAGVFAFDSAFPRPGVSLYIGELTDRVRAQGGRVTVFGHTDAVGSEAYNKGLADRRARAILALITTDVELFEQVCAEEDWGVAEHQAMMRAIGVDPGPPDGDAGKMTSAAVRAFQKGYSRGLWFESYQKPRYGAPDVTGELDEPTRRAIRDAYVNQLGFTLADKDLSDVRFAGCGEFNPRSDSAKENRRVTLAVFPEQGPSSPFPCVEGDAQACLVDGEGTRRCRFYREEVDEAEEPLERAVFFSDQWTPTPSKWAYISAITSLPDDTPVKFTVYRTRKTIPTLWLASPDDEVPNDLEEIASVDGTVAQGVALGVWRPPEQLDPWQTSTWFDDEELEPTDAAFLNEGASLEALRDMHAQFLARDHYRPPVFKVEGGGHWLVSAPPGRMLRALGREPRLGQDTLLVTPQGRAISTRDGTAALHPETKALYAAFGGVSANDEEEQP